MTSKLLCGDKKCRQCAAYCAAAPEAHLKIRRCNGSNSHKHWRSVANESTRIQRRACFCYWHHHLPAGKLTVYLGRRDFVDNTINTEPLDGVVLLDNDYLKGRKVFATVRHNTLLRADHLLDFSCNAINRSQSINNKYNSELRNQWKRSGKGKKKSNYW